VKAKLIMATE